MKAHVFSGVFSLPGCHLYVMTHPQSYKESLLSTLMDVIPEILFKGPEPSQGKATTTQLWYDVSLLHIKLLETDERRWIMSVPLFLFYVCGQRKFSVVFKSFKVTHWIKQHIMNLLEDLDDHNVGHICQVKHFVYQEHKTREMFFKP